MHRRVQPSNPSLDQSARQRDVCESKEGILKHSIQVQDINHFRIGFDVAIWQSNKGLVFFL